MEQLSLEYIGESNQILKTGTIYTGDTGLASKDNSGYIWVGFDGYRDEYVSLPHFLSYWKIVSETSDETKEPPKSPETTPLIATQGKAHCDNPKCPWPKDEFWIANMTDFDDKHFCTLECCEEFRKHKFKRKSGYGTLPSDDDEGIDPDEAERQAQEALARWSPKYAACRQCGKTDRKHIAKGLCSRCYQKYKANYSKGNSNIGELT